jgi:predicted RNA-binding protein
MNKILIKRWIVVDSNFNFKDSTPAIYFTKKQAEESRNVYYPNRKDIKVKQIEIII